MLTKSNLLLGTVATLSVATVCASQRPNIVVLFADDISAREFPCYGSDTWSKPGGGDTQDVNLRAQTPVINRLAKEGVQVETCWAATISSPSRAQMMTGRYAYQTKWWHNGDQGRYENAEGKQEGWPLYESSPMMMGKIAQNAGYATTWIGKTQMAHTDENIDDYGFDEGFYTPGDLNDSSPLTDFSMKKVGDKLYEIKDSGLTTNTYMQTSYFWFPSIMTVNTPENTERNNKQPWPVSEKDKKKFGLSSYAPDLEQQYVNDFMARSSKSGKPFLVYHTSHLGHDAYDFLHPESTMHWPGTPIVEWTGKGYKRTEPKVTGDKGVYDTHGTVTEPGIHKHITYLDYVVWMYLEQFKKLGIEDNTVFIICADNGTSRYGKASVQNQKGLHVPFIIYAPCLDMTKSGMQDVLMNIGDVCPTVADIVGETIPSDYSIDGQSLIPFLTTDKSQHREWIYGYRSQLQLIRGDKVLKDGSDVWYDVTVKPSDIDGFPKITDWSKVSAEHRAQRDQLMKILPRYNVYEQEHDGPGGVRVKPSKPVK